MRTLGVMTARQDASYRRSMEVVVRSDRGLEIGQVLCEAGDDALSHLDKPAVGSIVRLVSEEDVEGIDKIDSARAKKLETCQKHIDALGLDMKLIEVEQLFGGERMVVYYLSEERVDFRELVRVLASEFSTRIEMRQIGVRDEAKLLADYGDCGKPVCCNTHLSAMPPVSMKMAKLQKATLDPTKISGRCGRLKCCLRYEYDNYVDTQKQLPRVGSRVVTRNGTAKVLNQQILAEQLLVETEDHRRMVIDASEVLSVINPKQNERGSRKTSRKTSHHDRESVRDSNSASQSNDGPSETESGKQSSHSPASELNNEQDANDKAGDNPDDVSNGGKKRKRRSNRNRRRKRGPNNKKET
jgi:cell fate regulator YaaT (PSP1 superfamily)